MEFNVTFAAMEDKPEVMPVVCVRAFKGEAGVSAYKRAALAIFSPPKLFLIIKLHPGSGIESRK